MPTVPLKPTPEPSAERILLAMFGASLTVVGIIALAAVLPETLGITVALVALMAALASVGTFVRGLLRDPA
jgi:Na+/H+ antiporter NhaD/arsenite permease-like protein